MRQAKLILCLLFVLAMMTMVSYAQDDDACSSDTIEDAIDDLYAGYLTERSDDISDAAQALADGIDAILIDCANSDSLDGQEETNEQDFIVSPGRWRVNWSNEETACPDGSNRSTGTDRPFLLVMSDDGEGFTAIDNYAWPPLEFIPTDEENIFSFNRNAPSGNYTYRYDVTVLSSSDLEGTITLFFSNGCTVSDTFAMTLEDDSAVCLINSESGANLRSGPGTDFNRAGQLPAIFLQTVIGQATGSDGFVWWQLEDESWVRSDVVQEVGDCESVEVVED